MYIFPERPAQQEESAWIERSLQIGDCFDVILHNKAELCPSAFQVLNAYGITLKEDTYILVQFDNGHMWTADRLLCRDPVPLIDRIFAFWGSVFSMHLFTSGGFLYGLLAFDRPLRGEWFHWAVGECGKRLLETDEGKDLHILISKDEEGVQGIFHAANSLRNGLDYLRFFKETPRISFLDLQRQTALSDGEELLSYQRLAQSLGEQLRDEDFHVADAVRNIIRVLRRHSACSIESLHAQMQNFSLTLLHHLITQSIVDEKFIRKELISRNIMGGDSEENYANVLEHTLTQLHHRCLELNEKHNTERLCQIRSYALQHISSMDLSVSQIAEHFHVNRSKLTAEFRDCFGLSLAEFIYTARLDRAMLLLESHPSRSIEQIAREAGYCSLSTMYRAFQKSGQCTPAKYQNQWNDRREELRKVPV